jgi:DNA-binding PadR family transcriptional regulator
MISKALVAASTKPLLLTILLEGETYGYQIIKQMKILSEGKLKWSFGMLYPVLHRLEKDGYIASQWKASDEGRPRKYYRLTDSGRQELEREKLQWVTVNKVLSRMWQTSEVTT